ncbi:hypothetical protein WN73_37780 [Bradyrhizobium sp. CCBAU 45394]|nr:hypothetical protein [Bradyrhizobium sp. CCBAU 45394]
MSPRPGPPSWRGSSTVRPGWYAPRAAGRPGPSRRTTAQAVARRLGIADVEAEVLPDQRAPCSPNCRNRGASSPWQAMA